MVTLCVDILIILIVLIGGIMFLYSSIKSRLCVLSLVIACAVSYIVYPCDYPVHYPKEMSTWTDDLSLEARFEKLEKIMDQEYALYEPECALIQAGRPLQEVIQSIKKRNNAFLQKKRGGIHKYNFYPLSWYSTHLCFLGSYMGSRIEYFILPFGAKNRKSSLTEDEKKYFISKMSAISEKFQKLMPLMKIIVESDEFEKEQEDFVKDCKNKYPFYAEWAATEYTFLSMSILQ